MRFQGKLQQRNHIAEDEGAKCNAAGSNVSGTAEVSYQYSIVQWKQFNTTFCSDQKLFQASHPESRACMDDMSFIMSTKNLFF